ncbi:hypothetical protein FBU59_001441 [Linderina macrospora]|uniref:Uncharacterized protein n=1 Tax=Linderina macrospora TaxID=4868 RepID=A0ACC1JE86_9FUNG|nr:hypothetical protein FBU59_001441 [Linderina macrospora]
MVSRHPLNQFLAMDPTSIFILMLLAMAVVADECNLAYWKPRLMGTQMIGDKLPDHVSGRKKSFLGSLKKPRRIIRPTEPVRDHVVNERRITVYVSEKDIVFDVECS